jgi:hypothetical protein
MPALGTLHKTMKASVLPIRNADPTNTRPDKRKDFKDPNVRCTGNLYLEASWQMPSEPDKMAQPNERETLQERAKREEIMHTGKLTMKVHKADGLRAGDSVGFHIRAANRTADPYVIAYVKNEATGEWKHSRTTGFLEHLFRTKTCKSTLSPEWNEEFKNIVLKTGAFEKKSKQHWHLNLTKRQQQASEDEHAMDIFRQEELKLYFGDEQKEQKGEAGARHRVQIYLGDTIRQFKNKVMLACRKEAELEPDKSKSAKYRSVQMTVAHTVTVFVPSDKLRSLFNQAREHQTEYKRLYHLEEQDPSFWQPLDPIRTFNNYAVTYGFGLQLGGDDNTLSGSSGAPKRDPAQRLRIAEATPDYKMRNQRYKQFEEELRDCTTRVENTDTDKLCFGHGLYTHEGDGNTKEWRPILVDRPDASGDAMKRYYQVKWLYAFGGQDLDSRDAHAELDEESVLLAPRVPHILGSGTLEHQMFLDQAPDLRNEGLSDHDIAVRLNEKLKARFQMAKQADEAGGHKSDLMMPAMITANEVKHHFQKMEQEGRGTAPTSNGGSAGSSLSASPAPSNLPAPPMDSMQGGFYGAQVTPLQGGFQRGPLSQSTASMRG